MPRTYVALDLETTGLNANKDEIIEVGAVKFQDGPVLDTFHTLIKPRGLVPYTVQLLTGISDRDLHGAPAFAAIALDLQQFLAGCTLVAQNASFDLKFLAEHGLPLKNPVFDTLELTKVLVPLLAQRNLSALAGHFRIDYPVKHRAVPDATATREVFLALRERALVLEPKVLSPLCNLGGATGWSLGEFFQDILMEKVAAAVQARNGGPVPLPAAGAGRAAAVSEQPRPSRPGPGATARPLDTDRLAALLAPGGALARAFPGYEHRTEQVSMLRAIAEALNEPDHLLVEAGTGTGKSVAYLLPAVCFAVQNNSRVVVSTNTINLQEQIVTKDIPMVAAALGAAGPDSGVPAPDGLRVVQLKGRSNYLCPRRWNALASNPPGDVDPAFLARVTVWLSSTQTGDRGELNLNNRDLGFWSRISAQSESCSLANCMSAQPGGCFLQRARQRAGEAHLVVVNHALLISDIAAGNTVIPEYDYLVVDEAHHLEDVATDQLGFRASASHFAEFLDRIAYEAGGRRQGFLAAVEATARTGGPLFAGASGLLQHVEALAAALPLARAHVARLFSGLTEHLREYGEGSPEYGRKLRLTSGARRQPLWSQVEQSWEDLGTVWEDALRHLERIHGALEGLEGQVEGVEDLTGEAAALYFAGEELLDHGKAIIGRSDPDWVCWIEGSGQREEAAMCAAPVEVGQLLREQLFAKKRSVVLTSATLQTADGFGYVRGRLGIEKPREVALQSPFPYKQSALVLVPQDVPDPQRAGLTRGMEQVLADLCTASQGRALILFTSHSALQGVYRGLNRLLEPEGIRVLAQGISGNTHQLLQNLRSQPRTVLLGTSSFWEGVDVVGDALSLLVITKLPFSVPTEPVFAARSEGFDDPFREYAVPQAVLRFRQGFGRLIRSKTDRGVAVVLDSRVVSKQYGKKFLQSLPDVNLRPCALRETPRLVAGWLDGGGG